MANDTKFFEQLVGRVDPVSGVIHGVSIITGGISARGHDLEVDHKTLLQLHECASKMGKVPVKWNHRSGADAVAGYLTNFSIKSDATTDGKAKLLGDWHLLKSHPQYEQALELATIMPECIGLSAAFMGDDEKRLDGKTAARCNELISVDVVANPAANPSGFFEAIFPEAVDTHTKKQILMDTNTNPGKAQEPSLADLMGAITALGQQVEAQNQTIAELQGQGQQEQGEITVEDLLTLTPEQIQSLQNEGQITADDAAGIHAMQQEALAGGYYGDPAQGEQQQGEGGELAGAAAGVESSAGGGASELSALRSQVRYLSARFMQAQKADEAAQVEHHFAIVEGTIKELSAENTFLKELNTKLQTKCEAQAHALRTGTRPVSFSSENGDLTSASIGLDPWQQLVKSFEAQGKPPAEAIRLARKANPDAHVKHLSDLRAARSL